MIQNIYLEIPLTVISQTVEFFENFILGDESFAKPVQILETFVLVNNNLCRKLPSSLKSLTTFDESLKVT